mgnify:CR=1 FL=1
MKINELKEELQKEQQALRSTLELLSKNIKLDQNREENLVEIKRNITKLKNISENLHGDIYIQELKNWLRQYELELRDTEQELIKAFGSKLDTALKTMGLSLSGQYPELRAGLFTLELDFDQWETKLWYGPKQELLGRCDLSVNKIVNLLASEMKRLGSRLSEDELLEKLRKAYYRVVGINCREPAPIIQVMAEMSFLIQNARFLQDPKRENFISYSRADFSYDLFRVKKGIYQSGLHLRTATRAQTRQRFDFIWVPNDESGNGTAYSHLQIEEKVE